MMIDNKINKIREACAPVIGKTIECFETAQILFDDGSWDDWHDLPIRLYCTDQTLLSVSWSNFDDLWLSNDKSLSYIDEEATPQWRLNHLEKISGIIGRTIHSVWLGRGQMSIESREIEIWTRLLFDLGDAWFEVFNALDENGYEIYPAKPNGEFQKCI